MQRVLLSLNDFFGSIPRALRPWRWLIIGVALLGSIVMGVGVTKTSMDQTFDSWFDENDPALIALDNFRAQFGSDDGVFLVYRAVDGNVFSQASLIAIRDLHTQLEQEALNPESPLHRITRLQSLSDARVQINQGDTLRSQRLVPTPIPDDADALQGIVDIARQQTGFPLFYFSDNLQFGAVMIQTDFGAIPVETPGESLPDDLSFGGYSDD
ncbi:MAG: hypothetical protein WED11_08595, partial [Natronospirillum sp.]